MSKRVIVTGGAGFIGSHLCRRLLDGGNDVVCVDNYCSSSRENVEDLLDSSRFELIEHDVTKPFFAQADEIYNLACPASPRSYQRDPVETTRTNVLGALNVLELAQKTQVPVLQASTSEVYGDPQVHPQPEGYWGHVNPIGPRSCYDEGKRCAETLFFDYRRQHNTKIKVVRIFNTYGPYMQPDDGRVISNFIVQALRGRDITLYGDGSQTRSFCYAADLVEGLIRMMATPDEVTGPINLGNPDEITIAELANLIIEMVNSTSQIVRVKLPTDDPRQRRPDISVARQALKWQPSVPLRTGLTGTIHYLERLLAKGRTP